MIEFVLRFDIFCLVLGIRYLQFFNVVEETGEEEPTSYKELLRVKTTEKEDQGND